MSDSTFSFSFSLFFTASFVEKHFLLFFGFCRNEVNDSRLFLLVKNVDKNMHHVASFFGIFLGTKWFVYRRVSMFLERKRENGTFISSEPNRLGKFKVNKLIEFNDYVHFYREILFVFFFSSFVVIFSFFASFYVFIARTMCVENVSKNTNWLFQIVQPSFCPFWRWRTFHWNLNFLPSFLVFAEVISVILR